MRDNKNKILPRILFFLFFSLAAGLALELGLLFANRSIGQASAADLKPPEASASSITTRVSTETVLPAWTATPPAATATPMPTPMPTSISAPRPTMDPAADAWQTLPILPTISDTARQIYQKGLALGNDPKAFSKIGDCNTLSVRFLTYFDSDPGTAYNLEQYAYLQPLIDQFSDSFSRKSIAVGDGFNTSAVLSPFRADPRTCKGGDSPLECEYHLHKPSFAFIALGTDDYLKPDAFESNLRKIIQTTIDLGIVPILATKADNANQLNYNPIIARLAYEYDIPLWNLWRAFQPLPGNGLEDAMHPSGSFAAFDFSSDNLNRYGWTQRNLTALQSLYTVWTELTQP